MHITSDEQVLVVTFASGKILAYDVKQSFRLIGEIFSG
jgi:hypothetical protein